MVIKSTMVERLDVPRFSVAEGERRHRQLRKAMANAGIDCLVLPYNTGHWGQFQADVQYVTGMGGNDSEVCAVFPMAGEVSAWVRSGGYIRYWLGTQDWVTDIRNSGGEWGMPIVERIRELGLERSRIGVVGLAGLIRAPEGIMPYTMMETIKRELPGASFCNATDLMQEIRSVKSDEEITILGRAIEIAETASRAMAEAARPGARDALVYAAVYNAMLTNGGEIPTMVLWAAAAESRGNFYFPTGRLLDIGDIISSELEAKYLGYRAQVVQPVFVGQAKEPYVEMVGLSVEIFNKLCQLMKPGVAVGALIDATLEMAKGTGYSAQLVIHGRGLGEDRPLVTGKVTEATRSVKLRAGNVFILKPVVSTDEPERRINWGDTVLVTEMGARRLGHRPQGYSVSAP